MNEIIYRFNCDKCNYHTNEKGRFIKHCNSGIHKNGVRKTRSDKKEIFKCKLCYFESKIYTNYKTHILNNHSTEEEKKNDFNYYCKYCKFGVMAQSLYKKHLLTKKHQKIVEYYNSNGKTQIK